MSKILILGDTHFGARSANTALHSYMESVFINMFQYIDTHNIRTIFQLGDLFDVRKNIDIWVINFYRRVFLDEITKRGIALNVLVGNHDIYYRESVRINSIREIHVEHNILYPDIVNIIESPTVIGEFLCIPWVCKENYDEVMDSVRNTTARYCLGHFEFNGFEMQKGQVIKTKYDHKEFDKFEQVISGHYHHKSVKDNVLYAGTPYELTWMDCDDEKGFWVFEDNKLHFINTSLTFFNRIYGTNIPDRSEVENKHIQLILNERLDKKEYLKLIDSINLLNPLSLKVKECFSDDLSSDVITTHSVSTTDQTIRDYINDSELSLDKDRLIGIMNTLYREVMVCD